MDGAALKTAPTSESNDTIEFLMNNREFRQRIAEILSRQRDERLQTLRDEVRAEKKPPAIEVQRPKAKRRKPS